MDYFRRMKDYQMEQLPFMLAVSLTRRYRTEHVYHVLRYVNIFPMLPLKPTYIFYEQVF